MPVQHEFNHQIVVRDAAHRPWPMPGTPWIMTQSWCDLLFAHWQVDPLRLAALIPPPLQLDLFAGEAWIAVVPFRMEQVSPRGVPALPWISAFPELNVRTYVRVGDKPGVFFFSLDATNPLAVRVARSVFRLPYYQASIDVQVDGDGEGAGVTGYHSRRTDPRSPVASAELIAAYRPVGPVFHAVAGTREYFLTERYCLYTVDRHARASICEIQHARWPLQLATAEFARNTMIDGLDLGLALDPRRDDRGDTAGLAATGAASSPLLHFARRQDTVAWRPTRLV
jgi:uncharacterized protein YqjF (DUF2071 family)